MRTEYRSDLVGQRFGRLVVEAPVRVGARREWRCRCDCGNETIARTGNLRRVTKSCGCLKAESDNRPLSHGFASAGAKRSKEYRTWAHIKGRTLVETDHGFPSYGGRGIEVCDAWRDSFQAFLLDVGLSPSPRHSLDRIDNNGNYEPGNVRWATAAEQMRNTRRNIMVDGECLKDACARRGVSYEAAQMRLRRGNTIDQALSPLRGHAYRSMLTASQREGDDK